MPCDRAYCCTVAADRSMPWRAAVPSRRPGRLEQFGGLRHVDVHHRSEVGRPSGEVTHRLRHVTAGPGDGGRERREAQANVELERTGPGSSPTSSRVSLDSGGCGTEGDVDGVDRFAGFGRLAVADLIPAIAPAAAIPPSAAAAIPADLPIRENADRTLPASSASRPSLPSPSPTERNAFTSLVLADQAEDEVCAVDTGPASLIR